jgi:phosphoribosylanthranilate isomerase
MNTTWLTDNETTFIKVCGLREEESVDVAVGSGAHAIGFVFVPSSPRFIEREEAEKLILQLPDEVIPVAVLQDAPSLEQFSTWKGWLQLCGHESVETVETAPRPVIRATEWDEGAIRTWDACSNVKAILVDGSTGGRGTRFDVQALASIMPSLNKPIIIAGGLTPENVQEVIQQAKPAGVDVSSGIESSPGIKESGKICSFIQAVVDVD